MKIFISLVIIVILIIIIISWYFISGIHLDYLKDNGINKAQEICDEDSKIVYEGYERQLFGGFGGRIWYMCKIDNIQVDFYISRRLNTPELQVYSINQIFTIPNNFNINK